MAYNKTRISVWPHGEFTKLDLGLVADEDLADDMTATRDNHNGTRNENILTVEETETTLVVVYHSGFTQVYNWSNE